MAATVQRTLGEVGMPTLLDYVVHDQVTGNHCYQYQFTPKHHGADASAAQWLPSLTLQEEFAVFDRADEHELTDSDGYLYGIQRDGEDIRHLGTRKQQVAKFHPEQNRPWHGYPLYPLLDGPENRKGHKGQPEQVVFEKMFRAGLITRSQKRRFLRGNYA